MSFARVVCGVDGSPESAVALAQARRLLEPGGELVAVTVCDLNVAVQAGYEAARVIEQLREEADRAAADARQALADVPGATAVVVNGRPADAMLSVAGERQADLVALGTHGRSRVAGILVGTVAAAALHDASCSVLVAREPEQPESFPRAMVIGIDGSPSSERAATIGGELAQRFGCRVRVIFARGGKGIDEEAARRVAPELEIDDRKPLEALLAAASDADLLVVGSRGLHGLKSLGSISERVAHRAACSVLVLR
jgi:nucleotide-binding universal stress UspA family protein